MSYSPFRRYPVGRAGPEVCFRPGVEREDDRLPQSYTCALGSPVTLCIGDMPIPYVNEHVAPGLSHGFPRLDVEIQQPCQVYLVTRFSPNTTQGGPPMLAEVMDTNSLCCVDDLLVKRAAEEHQNPLVAYPRSDNGLTDFCFSPRSISTF